MKAIRFGVQVSGATKSEIVRQARRAETAGFSTLLFNDHIDGVLSPVPALMTAAAVTSRIRLGTYVLSNPFRNPVLVAKDAATVDRLIEGRLELGLGAGWINADFRALGVPKESGEIRVARLEESVRLIRDLLHGDNSGFKGSFYKSELTSISPPPTQERLLPILIGGGSKSILRLAGRHADIVGVHFDLRTGRVPDEDSSVALTERKIGWVREGAGARFDDLELQIGIRAIDIHDQASSEQDSSSRLEPPSDSPHVLFGTTPEVIDKVLRLRERFGFTYLVFRSHDMAAAELLLAAMK